MKREKALTELRPILDLEHTPNQSELERFQNDSLRPIIKFQHELIISLITNHKFFQKTMKKANTPDEYRALLKSFLVSQKELRQQLIGLVVGLFTLEELDLYQINSSEYQRRIIQIISQRVFDTVGPK